MRFSAFAAILASTTFLSGCAGTIAGVSLSSISSFAGFASTLFTGADLGEHAASLVTGKDCRFSEGLVREDRDICEEAGSPATRDDFHGIFVERIDSDGTVIFAAPKFMSASVGAGENENNTDVVWAQIKAQKAREETDRQLALAGQSQQIDVAALASGSLSSQSLGFLPVGFQAPAQTIDEEPASQTAARPRNFSNTAPDSSAAPVKQAYLPAQDQSEPPAIDEKMFTASMQIANATGAGGPFIAATTNATPVVSTLVNGEPVLVMRIGPVISPLAFATPSEPAEAPAEIAMVQPTVTEAPAPVASPQALVSSLPKEAKKVFVEMPAEAPVLPKPASKPKAKVAPVEIAEATPPKPAKAKPAAPAPAAPAPAPTIAPEDDVYQPPANDVFNSPAPDLTAAPTPASPAPVEVASTPATTGPAPLIPMPQP
jgi:hypothetical protein